LRESLFLWCFAPHAGKSGLDFLLETGDPFAIGGLGMKSFSRNGAKEEKVLDLKALDFLILKTLRLCGFARELIRAGC
jgi:hypothetical protein